MPRGLTDVLHRAETISLLVLPQSGQHPSKRLIGLSTNLQAIHLLYNLKSVHVFTGSLAENQNTTMRENPHITRPLLLLACCLALLRCLAWLLYVDSNNHFRAVTLLLGFLFWCMTWHVITCGLCCFAKSVYFFKFNYRFHNWKPTYILNLHFS